MTAKGPNAFRTISEAAAEIGAPAHVLRFWETRFTALRPMRRAGGRRLYRPEDLRLLRAVRWLLHEQGQAIGDLQGLSRRALLEMAPQVEPPVPSSAIAGGVERPADQSRAALESALAWAMAAKARLDHLLDPSGR